METWASPSVWWRTGLPTQTHVLPRQDLLTRGRWEGNSSKLESGAGGVQHECPCTCPSCISNPVPISHTESLGLLAAGGVDSAIFWLPSLHLYQQLPAITVMEWKGGGEKAGGGRWGRKWPRSLVHNMNSNEGSLLSGLCSCCINIPNKSERWEKTLEQEPAESRLQGHIQCTYSGMREAPGSRTEIPQKKRYAGGNPPITPVSTCKHTF